MDRMCYMCEHWNGGLAPGTKLNATSRKVMGECRRYPPAMITSGYWTDRGPPLDMQAEIIPAYASLLDVTPACGEYKKGR